MIWAISIWQYYQAFWRSTGHYWSD